MLILNNEKLVVPFIVGTGGVTKGDLVVLSAGTVVKATAGVTASTVVGIACDTKVAEAIVLVDVITSGTTVIAPFTVAGTKKTFADTDLGLVYDISNATTVNPDDTTGGCALITGYDNKTLEVRFVVPKASCYL